MNALDSARRAYSASASPLRTDRGAEYEAFARITRQLSAAAKRGRAGFKSLAEALHENRRLWTILAADVADTDNGLPQPLRAQIFYLSEFTSHQTRRILAGEAEVDILVDINTAIMRGLRNERADA